MKMVYWFTWFAIMNRINIHNWLLVYMVYMVYMVNTHTHKLKYIACKVYRFTKFTILLYHSNHTLFK